MKMKGPLKCMILLVIQTYIFKTICCETSLIHFCLFSFSSTSELDLHSQAERKGGFGYLSTI